MGSKTFEAFTKHLDQNYNSEVLFAEIDQEKAYRMLKDDVEDSFSQFAPHNKQWVKHMARSYIFYMIQYLSKSSGGPVRYFFFSLSQLMSYGPFDFWTNHMSSYMDLNFCFHGKPEEDVVCKFNKTITVHAAHQQIQTLLQGMHRKQSPLSKLNQDLIKILVDKLQIHSYTGIPWSSNFKQAS